MTRVADHNHEFLSKLSVAEIRWRDRQRFLESKGYMLRPRYRPDWRPSWIESGQLPNIAEDGMTLPVCSFTITAVLRHSQVQQIRNSQIDATRLSDGRQVYIKMVESDGEELSIALLFGSGDHVNEAQNHCVPVLDHFQDEHDPAFSYMVMPLLSPLCRPGFEHVVEITDMLDQLLEVRINFVSKRGALKRGLGLGVYA